MKDIENTMDSSAPSSQYDCNERPKTPVCLPCVFIVMNVRSGALYVGVTSDLAGRTLRNRADVVQGFNFSGGLTRLVWAEPHTTMKAALRRERQIGRWSKPRKLDLISGANPWWWHLWRDVTSRPGL